MVSEERLQELTRTLAAAQIIPVLRVQVSADAVKAVGEVAQAGLTVAELTTTTTGWQVALHECRAAWPGMTLGVGTVVSPDMARQAISEGVDFLVSPYPVALVRKVANEAGVPFLEGGLTPGEVAQATAHGVAKLFPAHLGGPSYLRSLLAILPGALIVPTGGIDVADAAIWLDAGALAVGVGQSLLGPGMSDRLASIRERSG